MTGLPDVSLNIPAPCPGDLAGHPAPAPPRRRPPAPSADGSVRGDGRPAPADALTDGPADGPADARTDGPADGPGDARGGALVVTGGRPAGFGPGRAMRAWLTARHWGAAWSKAAGRAITNPRGPYHAQPESLAGHAAYRRSRAWVPPGHEGRILGPCGAAYHRAATAGMAAGYSLAWVFARPSRLLIFCAVLGTVLGFWLG